MKILIEESVLRQALNALKIANKGIYTPIPFEDAITALRTALDAAEKAEPIRWMCPDYGDVSKVQRVGWHPLYTALYTHPAPAVPEETK